MKPKVAFFCGHKSPYGFAHFLPILESFDVRVVVLPTDDRWDIFNKKINGEVYYEPENTISFNRLKKKIKPLIPSLLRRALSKSVNTRENIRNTLRNKNIEILEIDDINGPAFLEKIQSMDVDLFLSAAYPQILSSRLLNIPGLGAINFHPSLLPKYRGAHPHFWQIVHGENDGGLSAHFMTEEIDRGDIVAQVPFDIQDCSYADLYEKMIKNTPAIVDQVRRYFQEPNRVPKKQNETGASIFRNPRKIHSRIFWNIHTSKEIINLTRTETAYCFFHGKEVVLGKSYATESNRNLTNGITVEPGTIVDVGKDSVSIKTIDGCVNVTHFVTENGKRMTYLQWAKIEKIRIGEKFF